MEHRDLHVSRETTEKLEALVALVEKWTQKINLISKSSVKSIWERHVLDSMQLFSHAPSSGLWVDLGSGGGFPGLVVSILSQGASADHQFILVESDQRKCAFLRTAIRTLQIPAEVRCVRIEEEEPLNASIVTARALAEVEILLGFANRHMSPNGIALFPKGENWKNEVEIAQNYWSCEIEAITSKTNPASAILKIKDIARV